MRRDGEKATVLPRPNCESWADAQLQAHDIGQRAGFGRAGIKADGSGGGAVGDQCEHG